MLSHNGLHEFLTSSAERYPERIAIIEPGCAPVTYRDLDRLSDGLRDRLSAMGVGKGDRVGIYLHKSVDSLASIFGILKTGAAYVPVDPGAPAARNAYIFNDCYVKTVILEEKFTPGLAANWDNPEELPQMIRLAGTGGGSSLKAALDSLLQDSPVPTVEDAPVLPEDLAYILYTSGSTGKPKGVMLTHRAGISYVDWCSEVFEPTFEDRFSSHAPFHFDLSILDIYVPIKHGASLVLISEEVGKEPGKLAELIAETEITVWYSTPSILSFLAQYGKLERYDTSHLRTILFAGEVFPINHLRALKSLLPEPRYYNLYGPTETNVCTYYEIPREISPDRTKPFPIGKACSHYEIMVIDESGRKVQEGMEGELCAHGPAMMNGYWNLPERSATAFLVDSSGKKWYKTGDIVRMDENGDYVYLGRRDRMVKKRGYRIELGEIEAALYRHPDIKEAAVIALQSDDGVKIKAFVSHRGDSRLSIIELKKFCLQHLPNYMVPDLFHMVELLPKTSTDKIDYQRLAALA